MAKLDTDGGEPRAGQQAGWTDVLDKLILGVTHQISNRVATLAGVSDILANDPSVPPILRALSDEVPRLEESIRLLRLLAIPDDEREEALEAPRVVHDAVALATVHPDYKNTHYDVADGRDVPPVLARPTELTHAVLVALTDAASRTPDTVSVDYGVEGGDLLIRAGDSTVRATTLAAARSV
jgi:hypothetical protein